MYKDISKQLWIYLSEPQRDLVAQALMLSDKVSIDKTFHTHDYSFIVFPLAKAYEGFLKQVFLDVGFIRQEDYLSQHFRIGKVLSPHLVRRLGRRSVYKQVCDSAGCIMSEMMWESWKIGRNQVFHYYPHNVKQLSFDEALAINNRILNTMEFVMEKLKLLRVKAKLVKHIK